MAGNFSVPEKSFSETSVLHFKLIHSQQRAGAEALLGLRGLPQAKARCYSECNSVRRRGFRGSCRGNGVVGQFEVGQTKFAYNPVLRQISA